MDTERLNTEEEPGRRRRFHPILAFALSTVFVVLAVTFSPVLVYFLMPRHPIAFEMAARGLPAIIILFGYFGFVRYAERLPLRFDDAVALPLRRRPLLDFLLGCGIAAIMVTICVALIALIGDLDWRVTLNAVTVRRTAVMLLVILVAALLEELMFRGYPFQRLAIGIGKIGAVLLFSLLFGAIHWNNPNSSVASVINTVAIGVTLAVAYFWTNSLWMPFGLHFAWNFVLGVIFGLPVSGLRIFETFAHGVAHGPRWVTGGAYGIEASATASVVIIATTLVLLYLWLREAQKAVRKTDELPVAGIQ